MIPPTPSRSPLRSALLCTLVTLVAAASLAACGPAPAPTPTPTAAFASEEEAFAAAEATYRAFTRRLNEIDLADPRTFEPLFELSSGEFESADRKAYSSMHAKGFTIDGTTTILSFEGTKADLPRNVVEAEVCLDVSDVTVVDSAGASQVDPNRPNIYALDVAFVSDGRSLTIDSASVDRQKTCTLDG